MNCEGAEEESREEEGRYLSFAAFAVDIVSTYCASNNKVETQAITSFWTFGGYRLNKDVTINGNKEIT